MTPTAHEIELTEKLKTAEAEIERLLCVADAIRAMRDALNKYHDAMDAIYITNEVGRALVVQHFGTTHPPIALKKEK